MKHMKRMKRKSLLLVAGIVLMLTIAIGGTIAYLVANTDPVVNTFTPGEVPITIQETFNGTTKSNVYVTNNGNVSAYIRAKIIVTWKDKDGNVSAIKPVLGTDYSMSTGGGWTKESDGFYYYSVFVGAGKSTGYLINSCTRIGAPPAGYDLSVEIIAESIQAEGMSVNGAVEAFNKAKT